MKSEYYLVFGIALIVLVSGCTQQAENEQVDKLGDVKFSCENDNSVQARGYVLLMGLADHHKEGWDVEKSLMEQDPKSKFVLIYDQDENSHLEQISQKFLYDLESLLVEKPVDELVIFGASAGGVTASYSINKLNFSGPVALHTLSSPLKGYWFPEVFLGERATYEKEIALGLAPFQKPGKNVKVYHHKTVTDTILKDHYCGNFAALCDPIKIQNNNIQGSKEFYYPKYDHNPLMGVVIREVLKCYNSEISETIEEIDADQVNRLGSLCYDEESCNAFCLNNRGRCTDYCNGNPENSICKKLFGALDTDKVNTKSDEPINIGCKNNSKPIFTSPFTDLSKIEHITPIGNIKAGSQSRSYVFANRYENGTKALVPIYAPTNATLFGLVYAWRGDKTTGRGEYRLDIRASCEVIFAFDHVTQITDRLKEFAPEVPAEDTRRQSEISVPITEGELLGYTDGVFASGGFDFFLLNYEKEVSHINPSRWTSDHNKYADCPYDYFTEDLKKQYYSMFASAGGEKRKSTCRSASRDVAGTLSGAWFKEKDATDAAGTRLLVGSDFSTVDLVVDENNPLATGSVLSIRHQSAPVKPEDVKIGGSVCYSDGTNHAFLKLLTETQMGSDIRQGPCPSILPDNYEIWER